MNANQRKVLALLRAQKLTVEEAESMLGALEPLHKGENPVQSDLDVVGTSEATQALRARIEEVAKTDAPALIHGEHGTGKALIARIIHSKSRRAGGPFMGLDGAASVSTLEVDLFGRESETDGVKKGLLELASGGTLLIDFTHLLTPDVQHRLYSFLQNGYLTRVNGVRSIYADVRVIGATSQDLSALSEEGRFRTDLYERLQVGYVYSKPLREHKEDIPELARYFAQSRAKKDGRQAPTISEDTMAALMAYDWPKNVRELSTVIDAAVIQCDGDELRPEHLNLYS